MLEILQLYVSGFWIWLGITIGLGAVLKFFLSAYAITICAITKTDLNLDG